MLGLYRVLKAMDSPETKNELVIDAPSVTSCSYAEISTISIAKKSSHPELVIDVPRVSISSFDEATTYDIAKKSPSSWILTRFHAGYFRMSLSFSGQALLWKSLHDSPIKNLLAIQPTLPSDVFILFWLSALIILSIFSPVYILRCFFHFNLVKTEFRHKVGVNYLFAPWISWLLLLQSSPFITPKSTRYKVMCWLFICPVLALDVKIYGQWFTKGTRVLSVFANPASQMTVIANLVGARSAAQMGWKETSMFLFSVGITHYVVLFVTLYQRPLGIYQLPARLRPVFFLFIATPSATSLTWRSLSGSFGTASKILFFLSFFHFASLVCRPNLFKKAMRRFNVAWWAYSFPLTVLAMASAEYTRAVKDKIAHCVMLGLLLLSVVIFISLIVSTVINYRTLLDDTSPIFSPAVQLVTVYDSDSNEE